MDVQLKELIEVIKTEGQQEAENKAKSILEQAETEKKSIIASAQSEAEKIVSQAKAEAAKIEQAGTQAVKQASRDLLLSLSSEVEDFFKRILQVETGAAYSQKVLEEGLFKILSSWAGKKGAGIEVLLPEAECGKLSKAMLSKLSGDLKKGVEFKPLRGISAGFRIGEKNGGAFYDFSSEGLAQMLGEFLSPRLKEILSDASKE